MKESQMVALFDLPVERLQGIACATPDTFEFIACKDKGMSMAQGTVSNVMVLIGKVITVGEPHLTDVWTIPEAEGED